MDLVSLQLRHSVHCGIKGSICEISAAVVGCGGRRLRHRMTTQATLLEGIYSHDRNFSSRG